MGRIWLLMGGSVFRRRTYIQIGRYVVVQWCTHYGWEWVSYGDTFTVNKYVPTYM